MDQLLFGRLVHGEQPDQVLEPVPLVLTQHGQYLVEQRLDLGVLREQQVDDVRLHGVCHGTHLPRPGAG